MMSVFSSAISCGSRIFDIIHIIYIVYGVNCTCLVDDTGFWEWWWFLSRVAVLEIHSFEENFRRELQALLYGRL